MNLLPMTDEAISVAIGQRLKALRLYENLTQAHVAAETGISRRTIQTMEDSGKTTLLNLVSYLRAIGELERLAELVREVPQRPIDLVKTGHIRLRASGTQEQPDTLNTRSIITTADAKDTDW